MTRKELSEKRYKETIKAYFDNPDLTIKQLSELIGISTCTAGRFIDRHFKEKDHNKKFDKICFETK